jgi:2,3-bisphosphoglycerate-independent phosphoglycerate mutase
MTVMKFVVLVGDGMGDYPLEILGGKTPLQAADIPAVRRAARAGERMMLNTVRKTWRGSDVRSEPAWLQRGGKFYRTRAIEAAGAASWARKSGLSLYSRHRRKRRMVDYSAATARRRGRGTGEVAGRKNWAPGRHFHTGVSIGICAWDKGPKDLDCAAA